jgi:class 3 adenylate cyclase
MLVVGGRVRMKQSKQAVTPVWVFGLQHMNTRSGDRVERRLAAIMAADVAGYSRLMGVDEEDTLRRLNAHRGQLVDPKVIEHGGRIVKSTGDGLLVEFPSVVNAVRCAAEIQRAMVDRNSKITEDRRITFRVGINLGDTTTSSVTASTSRRGWRHWPSRAASAYRARCTTISVTDCPMPSTTWESRASRTSRARCVPMQ